MNMHVCVHIHICRKWDWDQDQKRVIEECEYGHEVPEDKRGQKDRRINRGLGKGTGWMDGRHDEMTRTRKDSQHH